MKHYTSVKRYGSTIFHRFIQGGTHYSERVSFSPTLFVTTNEETDWNTIKGVPVKPKRFHSITDAQAFVKSMDGIEPKVIHGIRDYELLYIHETYPDDIRFDFHSLKYFFLDIETDSKGEWPDPKTAQKEINAITVYDSSTKKYHSFYTVKALNVRSGDNRLLMMCRDEIELLREFILFWSNNYPDIASGWNSNGFDYPYIVSRILRMLGEDFVSKLSPWGRVSTKEVRNAFGTDTQIAVEILGIELLDYLELYKKFTHKNQESYTLGNIADVELDETKLEYEGALWEFMEKDPDNYIEYNIRDVELLVKLEAKLQLLYTCTTLAYLMKVNFNDALGTVKPWTSKIADETAKEQIVIDAYSPPQGNATFEAAYVKEPIPGKYSTLITLDARSMYPSMIMGFNISPEKKIDSPTEASIEFFRKRLIEQIENGTFKGSDLLSSEGICVAGNGQPYSCDGEGILPKITRKLFNMRNSIKGEMISNQKELESKKEKLSDDLISSYDSKIRALDIQQDSVKVALNSLFGATGNKYFPLFDLHSAEAITFSGQAGIRFVSRRVSEFISNLCNDGVFKDYVIYIDTDSLAINLEDIIKKFGINGRDVDTIAKIADIKLQEVAREACEEFSQITNMFSKTLDFKREKICCSFGAVYVAKKRYFMMVDDSEGVRYGSPKLDITGLETERSSTPKFVRNKLKEAFELVLKGNEEDVQKFVKDFFEEFKRQPLETIAFPRGVNDLEKYFNKETIYSKGTPMHTRASLLYNDLLRKKNLENHYTPIRSGDKIKFIHLKDKNPLREDVIGWLDKFPKEFELNDYIDYETMFDKTFVKPLENVLKKIGWNIEPKSSLEDFF